MIDRQLLGDVGLAILLALPTAALSRPQPSASENAAVSPMVEQAAHADASATERRFSVDS